jgi:hypothetical protein
MTPVELQHAPCGTENGPQEVQPPKAYGCCAFFLRDLAEIDGGEGGIRSRGSRSYQRFRPDSKPSITKSTQNLRIGYKTGTAQASSVAADIGVQRSPEPLHFLIKTVGLTVGRHYDPDR